MTRQHTRAASLDGIELAKKVLSRRGWSKNYLATQVVVDDDHLLNDKPVSDSTVKRFVYPDTAKTKAILAKIK